MSMTTFDSRYAFALCFTWSLTWGVGCDAVDSDSATTGTDEGTTTTESSSSMSADDHDLGTTTTGAATQTTSSDSTTESSQTTASSETDPTHDSETGDTESSDTTTDGTTSTSEESGTESTGDCDPDPLQALPDEILPRCQSETRDCLAACDADDWTCHESCIAMDELEADPDWQVDCEVCTFWQYAVCVQNAGCQAEADAYQCCEAAGGAGGCEAEIYALYECGFSTAPDCERAFLDGRDGCFPE